LRITALNAGLRAAKLTVHMLCSSDRQGASAPAHLILRDVTVAQLPLQLCDQAVLCTALPSMCEQFPMSPVAQFEFTPLVLPPLRPRSIAVPDKLVYRKMF
jgi:hypothetical protein